MKITLPFSLLPAIVLTAAGLLLAAAPLVAQTCLEIAIQKGQTAYNQDNYLKAREYWQAGKDCPSTNVQKLNGLIWKTRDADGDGIVNGRDKCANTPGPVSNNGCPETKSATEETSPKLADRDRDGVADKDDKCPDTPGPKQFNGCEDSRLDRDLDGVPDDEDKCPNMAGFPKNKGCSDEYGRYLIHEAVEERNLELVEKLIRSGQAIDMEVSKGGATALHLASEKGYMEIIETLIEHGADWRKTDDYGNTNLHYAASQGGIESVKYFFDRFGPDRINIKNDEGETPLHQSITSGSEAVVGFLIANGGYVNAKSKIGLTPISNLPLEWNFKVAKLLLDNGANPNDYYLSFFGYKFPILCEAASNSQYDIMKILLEKGANVNAKDEDETYNLSPLLWSLRGYQEDNPELTIKCVDLLLGYGANPNAVSPTGATALHLAAAIGKREIVQSLLKKGAKKYATFFDKETNKSKTPWDLAQEHGKYHLEDLLK